MRALHLSTNFCVCAKYGSILSFSFLLAFRAARAAAPRVLHAAESITSHRTTFFRRRPPKSNTGGRQRERRGKREGLFLLSFFFFFSRTAVDTRRGISPLLPSLALDRAKLGRERGEESGSRSRSRFSELSARHNPSRPRPRPRPRTRTHERNNDRVAQTHALRCCTYTQTPSRLEDGHPRLDRAHRQVAQAR